MNSRRKVAVTLILGVALWACDQTGLGVGSALKNLVSLPVQGLQSLGNAITGNTYSSYAKQTDELRSEVPNSCADLEPPQQGVFSRIRDAMLGVRDDTCTCRPWGSCPPSNCNCKALCPDSFDIFSVHQERNSGETADELAFSNTYSAFKNNPMTQGYCWGHASVTAKFNRLAFFQPGQKPKFTPNTPEWRNYYKGLIDDILANRVADIPGFENLQDFSDHPAIQELLADRVAQEWSDKAMTFSGLGSAMKSQQMEPSAAAALVKDLKSRVAHYQAPQIVFTMKDQKFSTHVTLISEVREQGRGVSRICLRDNNHPASRRSGCGTYLDVYPSGRVDSLAYGPIGGVSLAGNEEADTVEQLHSLRKRCEKTKGCT